MDRERIEEIFENTESELHLLNGKDNAFEGLKIISKYTNKLIVGAEHDIIHSEEVENLIKAGITEEDVIQLAKLNWMIDEWDIGLACFV